MSLVLEYGYTSFTKYGEELCGDNVAITKKDDYTTLVLADGLGSGVRANILSTLTSKILMTMISNDVPIEECVETIIETLPILKNRGVAYSTFSVIHINNEGKGYLFEFDNPRYILLHHGKATELQSEEIYIMDKKIYVTKLELEEEDVIVLMSDGVPCAGSGITLNYGWQREDIIKFLEINANMFTSARAIACMLASASEDLYLHEPYDDTTVLALKYREATTVNLLIGPPANIEDETRYIFDFLSNEGYKIVCGGTTSKIVANYLGEELKMELETKDKEVPPIGYIKGIDLVTEGVLTLSKLLEYAKVYAKTNSNIPKMFYKDDGASLLADYLLEKATKVNFYVGQAINNAYKSLKLDNMLKFKLVEELASILKSLNKEVMIKYY